MLECIMHHLLPYSDSYLYWCLAYIREGISDLSIYVAVTSPYSRDRGVTEKGACRAWERWRVVLIVMKWSGKVKVFIEEKWSIFFAIFLAKNPKKQNVYPLGGIFKTKLQIPPNNYNTIGIEARRYQKNLQIPPPNGYYSRWVCFLGRPVPWPGPEAAYGGPGADPTFPLTRAWSGLGPSWVGPCPGYPGSCPCGLPGRSGPFDTPTRQLANCDENYKFSVYPYNMLQEFAVDSEVIVTSHPKVVRKSHAWRTGSHRVLRRLLSWLTSWTSHGILISASSSAEMMCLCLLSVLWSNYYLLLLTRHGGQVHFHHHGLDMMHQYCCHDNHLGAIEMFCEESPHSVGSSFFYQEKWSRHHTSY